MKNKKKVLYFVSEDYYFLSHRIDLARDALKRGYKVVLLSNMNKDEDYIKSQGIKTIHIPIERSSKNLLSDIFLLTKIFKIIKQEGPDILHCVSLKPILYGTFCARLIGKIKIVNTFAGLGILVKYQSNFFKQFIINFFLRLIIKSENVRLIVQNKSDKKYFLRNKIIEEKNLNLILGSGVDMKKYSQSLEKRRVVNIILVSRMLWSKGISEFVKVSKKFKKNKLVRFTLVGSPDEKNPDSVSQKYLEKLNSFPNFTWKGFSNDVKKELNNADIFFLPTSYGEGIPKALIEAAASGLALVVSNNPGCKEIVDNEINGYICDCKNLEEFYFVLNKLIHSNELRTRFGNSARKKVELDFSIEKINEKTLSLYNS